MSWLPILLIVWVTVDVLIVAAVAYLSRRAAADRIASSASRPFVARAVPKRRAERPVH